MIRENRWYKLEEVSWLAEDDIQADPLGDLVTKDNKLSVWYIKDNRTNFDQVVAALAASRDTTANLDYVLFNPEILSEINIKIEETKGNSLDERANAWHRDLTELSGFKLVELAKAILVKGARDRISEKQIIHLIAQAVKLGRIDRARLSSNVAVKTDKFHGT